MRGIRGLFPDTARRIASKMGEMNMRKRKGAAGLLAALMYTLFLFRLPAWAAQGEPAIWASVQDQIATVYLRGMEPDQIGECTIGSTLASPSTAEPLSELEKPVETVVLIDNSDSISEPEQALLHEILTDLIANRMSGESYTIATVADKVDYLCEDESDFAALKSAISALEYQAHETYMIDGIYSVLDRLAASDEGILRRLVIVSDGTDHQTLGYTTDELDRKASACGYPIYVLGCRGDGKGESGLKELFALARATSGEALQLTEESDSVEIVTALTDWNHAVRMEIDLPDSVCDGSDKVLRCTGTGAQSCSVTISMPVVVSPDEQEVSSPPPEESKPEELSANEQDQSAGQGQNWLVWCLVAAGVIAAGAILAFILFRKKKNSREKPDKDGFQRLPSQQEQPAYSGDTVLSSNEADGDGTVMMWDQHKNGILILEDLDQPGRKFDAPLSQGPVIVGRDDNCTIPVQWSPTVSRSQCEIVQRGGQVFVRNTSASNITKLDGKRLEEETPLVTGSLLKMGNVTFRVTIL